MLRFACLLLALLLPHAARAELRGHGGPVRALAVSADGRLAMSGSFDQSAILWDVEGGAALSVLRFHEGAVNAVASLPDGRFATGGEDGRIALWRLGRPEPEGVIEAHKGPVVSLTVAPDGLALASASWDGTARVTPLAGSGAGMPDAAGAARVLEGHQGPVNAVAFLPDGRIVTGGYDATLRIWPRGEGATAIHQLPTPLNAIAAAPDGEIVAGGADGMVRILKPDGRVRAQAEAEARPVIALRLSPDGTRIAAASVGGSVAVLDRAEARLLFRLVGPGLPVWSLAFRPDGAELLTGGSDRLVRRWDMRTGEHIGAVVIARPEDVLAGFQGERGAEVFQACAACHTLTPDGGNRAGPTLHGVFGRRIATAPGYNFSPALRQLDIVWNAETIAKLFEVGPAQYTPGTKMPEQQIGSAADREALVRFLERATR
ncbi:MAG TPA: c-type cytochrome [Microvirga sp.]|jgi:cytochrome c|nr:c-type cytochrome [Microvirga sp.]